MKSISTIKLLNNMLSGELPPAWGNMRGLSSLWMSRYRPS